MADIAPFQGIRYNPNKVPSLSKVVAPPYDVINEAYRAKLASRDERNVVRLILPSEEGAKDRYAAAAETLRRWLGDGTFVEDATPAIYVIAQEWQAAGKGRRRTGFIAAVRLERFGEGKIYPHENTLSAPKEDRLKLMTATRANLSQVFSIFPDEKRDADAWLNDVTAAPPLAQAADDAGVVTRLWAETDAARVAALRRLMADRAIFIADGHHRYETALNYRKFCAETRGNLPADAPENAIMMLCVAMNNDGLITLPTHRLLPRAVAEPDRLIERLKEDFGVHPIATFSGRGGEVDALLRSDATPNLMVLYVGKGRSPMKVAPKNPSKILGHMSGYSEVWRSLDVSILQYAVLERMPGLTLEHVSREGKIGYDHDADEALKRVDSGEFASAFILRPTPVSAVADVASHLEKMPPKSTFFYPKALTGMVMRQL